MNFKAFLKNNLISESETVLFENSESDKQKDAFIRSAYKRIIPNGSEKADVDKMWNAIRSKAYYKLSQNSKPETRKAVQQAKGALSRGKQFGLKSDEPEAEEKDKTVSNKILDHLEDWTEEDLKQLKDSIQNSSGSFILNSVTSLEDLKNVSDTLEPKDQELLFDLIKKQEHEVEGEIDWKDKTFDDLDSIKDDDFSKIKDKLKETLGVDDSIKLDSLDGLKDYLKKNKLDNDKLQELDKLLDTEEAKVPATTATSGQQEPQENKVPATTNQEILDNIQKKQQEQELNDHLKKLGLDITSLDTGNTEVVQKIIDSGDPLLYDTYIAKNLPETSEIVQKIKKEEEERQRVQREALERRTERFEELKQSGKVLAGVGAIFDVLASALSGKGTNFFETMAQKQTLAKGIAEGITTQLSGQYEAIISNEDSNHSKELDALKINYDQRLKDLESQKADPSKTVAYKKLIAMASQKYSESLSILKDETQSASQRVASVSSLNVFMSTDDLSSLDSASKTQMVKVLSEKYPRQKIQDENGTEREESEDEYLARIKSEAKNDDIQGVIDDANNDLAMCKEKEKELNDSFSKSLEDLKQNPEVQDEIKLAEQNYKNQKAIIESEYNKAKATENTRYEKTVHCLRKTMDENKRFAKNISVLAMHSENPMDIIMHEMASRNKRLQDRAKLETGTDIFNEENCPSDPKELQEMFNNASKGSEGKPKKGKVRDDDEEDDYFPKKLKKPSIEDKEENPETSDQGDLGKTGDQKDPEPEEIKDSKEPKDMNDFVDDSPKETKKTEPLSVKTDNLDDIKKLDLKLKDTEEKDIDLSSIDNNKWNELLANKDFKTSLEAQLKSPEVLKKLSGEDAESEKAEIDELTDEEQDVTDKEKTKLGDMNFKTLWSLLNKEGISIRALPGYNSDMSPEQKADLIRNYIKEHKEGVWSSLTESKTSQSRLSSLIEANNRKIQKGSLKKFAELLVNDVRTFG